MGNKKINKNTTLRIQILKKILKICVCKKKAVPLQTQLKSIGITSEKQSKFRLRFVDYHD